MPKRRLTTEDIHCVEAYRAEVLNAFGRIFAEARNRFADGDRLLRRFNDAVVLVLNGASFRAVDDAHNELCIARALLLNTKLPFMRVEYEPRLPGCAKSIDFRAISADGATVFVDVKTIKPEPKDRWEQFERAVREKWFPDHIIVALSKDWMGGEIWHGMFAARARMLEYTLELEAKVRECGLKGRENPIFVLALCGAGFEWREDQLEDFVQFYRNGRHRSDDPFAKVEAHFIEEEKASLDRTVSRFACMRRRQFDLFPERLNWDVQGPADPIFDAL